MAYNLEAICLVARADGLTSVNRGHQELNNRLDCSAWGSKDLIENYANPAIEFLVEVETIYLSGNNRIS